MASFGRKPAVLTAIELGRRSVRVVSGRRRSGSFVVDRSITETIPASVDRDDPPAMGAFLAEVLSRGQVRPGAVLAVVTRDTVAMKRMELPTATTHELPDMVRLAMRRELPIEGAATIDFLPDPPSERATSVLAVAAPDATLSGLVACLEAAGRRVDGIGLRTLGTAALLEPTAAPTSLLIDLGAESIDFIVVDGGRIVFSRGAAIRGDLASPESAADAAVAETKRTWLSYLAANPDRPAPADVVLIADDAVAARARPALAELVGAAVHAVDVPVGIGVEEGMPALGGALPLAMLLRAAAGDRATIDLRRPRKAPDMAARRRQLVLAAVGLLAVAAIAGYTSGRRAARLDADRRADVVDKARTFAPEGRRLRRDEDRLRHLEQWSRPPQDVIADLLYMKGLLPDPGDVVIDSVAASEEFKGVRWDGEKGWSSAAEVRIVLEGEAKTRAIADALRERLVEDRQFVVTTSGSDTRGGNRLPYPFGYLMRSERAAGAPSTTAAATSPTPSSATAPSAEGTR